MQKPCEGTRLPDVKGSVGTESDPKHGVPGGRDRVPESGL